MSLNDFYLNERFSSSDGIANFQALRICINKSDGTQTLRRTSATHFKVNVVDVSSTVISDLSKMK